MGARRESRNRDASTFVGGHRRPPASDLSRIARPLRLEIKVSPVSLLPKLPAALGRILAALKPRPVRTDAASPANDNVWNQPLNGDAWIGVFLIGLSVLSIVAGLQRYYG